MKKLNLFILSLIVVSVVSNYSFAQTGTIVGSVKFIGENPNYPETAITKDPEVCGAESKPSEKLVLSAENGIKDAFVSVIGVTGEKLSVPEENPVFAQSQCEFTNHVMVVPSGTTVDFPNKEDKVMHNLHSYSMKNRPFNKGVPFGAVISNKFSKPETVKITCDVHKWMVAYLIVHDDPYFCVTDENGNYKIENVPVGTYKLQVWQETLGRKKFDVTVTADEETKVDIEMTPRKRRKKK